VRIGLLTSGGDAPGMNAAIRAVVRCATERGAEMLGVHRGYDGLVEGDVQPLDNRAVGGIIERGGTMLRSARSAAFLAAQGREKALAEIRRHSLDELIVIGGNGSLRGVHVATRQRRAGRRDPRLDRQRHSRNRDGNRCGDGREHGRHRAESHS